MDVEGTGVAPAAQQPQVTRERSNSLAQYSLALAAACRNPRDFYDQDVVGESIWHADTPGARCFA